MKNHFGFKDFILLLLVCFVGFLSFSTLRNVDRLKEDFQNASQDAPAAQTAGTPGATTDVHPRLDELEAQLTAQLEATLERIKSLETELVKLNVTSTDGGGAAQLRAIQQRLDAIEQQYQELQEQIQERAQALLQDIRDTRLTGVDDSWAVPGVAITRPARAGFAVDPRNNADFQYGGELKAASGTQTKKVVPYISGDAYASSITAKVLESSATLNPITYEWEGVLGEAWQQDPEGLWVRIKIHDRAVWSDNKPVTAADYAWTYHDYIQNKEILTPRTAQVLENITEVVALSEKVVEFRYRERLFNNLDQALGFGPLPEHFYGQFTPSELNSATALVMGSGPYMPEKNDPNDQWTGRSGDFVLVRNPNYWGEKPPFDSIRNMFLTSGVAVMQQFENQVTDYMGAGAEQWAKKSIDPDFFEYAHIMQWEPISGAYSFIAWNAGEKQGKLTPFHDKRVRRAMTHMIDRERLVRDLYKGIGTVAYSPFPKGPASSPNVKPLEYNPDESRRLLREAGWYDRNGDGIIENEEGEDFRFEFTIPSGIPLWLSIANYVKDQALSLGIECTVQLQEWSMYGEKMDERNFDAICLAWRLGSNPESDPRQIWHTDGIRSGDNFVQWDAGQDALIDAGRRSLDREDRLKIWHQLHELINDEQPYTFMIKRPTIMFINNRVGNALPLPATHDTGEWYHRATSVTTPEI